MTHALGDVELLTQQDCASWDAYVLDHHRATLFHSTRWKTAIEATYGHRGYYLFLKEGERIAGILPLFLVDSRLLGRTLVALPFAGTQPSVCADDRRGETRLVARAAALAEELGAGYVEFREDEEKPWDLPVRHSYVNVRLPLSADIEALWRERVDSRVRTKVRAARNRGLRVEWAGGGGGGAVNAFFRLYAETMHRLGSPPHSKALFQNVAEAFAGETQIVLVMDGEDPVAGAFMMYDGHWVGFPWAASLTQARAKHPNNLLYWAIIEWACERGYKTLDLGRSPAGSGPAHFKTQWGGVARPLSYYYALTGASKPPGRDGTDPAMVLASRIWRRLPRSFANWAGPSLARLIP
jgi:FemAB-related protein (PEP-CTERM system-associated)